MKLLLLTERTDSLSLSYMRFTSSYFPQTAAHLITLARFILPNLFYSPHLLLICGSSLTSILDPHNHLSFLFLSSYPLYLSQSYNNISSTTFYIYSVLCYTLHTLWLSVPLMPSILQRYVAISHSPFNQKPAVPHVKHRMRQVIMSILTAYHVVSCHVTSYHFISYHITSCRLMSTLFYHTILFVIRSYQITLLLKPYYHLSPNYSNLQNQTIFLD